MKLLILILCSFSLFSFSAEKAKVHKYKAEMSCADCANNIKVGLTEMKKKIKSYDFDIKAQTVSIVFEGENKALTKDELAKLQSVSGYILEASVDKKIKK